MRIFHTKTHNPAVSTLCVNFTHNQSTKQPSITLRNFNAKTTTAQT
nr:MAG TPA: hypothetical protein [Bacteriophage sp.]